MVNSSKLDPSKLFRLLAPYTGENLNEKTPVNYLAEYYSFIFNTNQHFYNNLINTTKIIIDNSKNPQQDLGTFIKGVVLSKPYDSDKYVTEVASIAEGRFINISEAINSWLEAKFKENHVELFQKLSHLAYHNTNTGFDIQNSWNPSEIQRVVQKTYACINDDPLSFFEQVILDVGTIYLLAVPRDQKDTYQNMKKGEPNLGYIRLYPYHSIDKKEILLSVDNIWVNNNNKDLVCSLVDSLMDLSKYLDLPIIDKTMSRNYIIQNGHLLDIYCQTQDLFKLGRVPETTRYSKLASSKEDDGFYILKPLGDCR